MLLIKKLVPLSLFHQSRMSFCSFVGIAPIRFNRVWHSQKDLIKALQTIERDDFQIQIFKKENIISANHLYYAVYFSEQAFALNSNISKKKTIEYLLYASLQRQIKSAIDFVGFTISEKNHSQLAYIVITAPKEEDLRQKYSEILKVLEAEPADEPDPAMDMKTIQHFQNYYQISDFELKNALLCSGLPPNCSFKEQKNELKLQTFLQVITEKMAQLLMENFKHTN